MRIYDLHLIVPITYNFLKTLRYEQIHRICFKIHQLPEDTFVLVLTFTATLVPEPLVTRLYSCPKRAPRSKKSGNRPKTKKP